MNRSIWCERGGAAGLVLVLLHGMGANGAVWDGVKPLLATRWTGRWLIPDLRGHGRSPHAPPYGMGVHAADVASLLGPDDEAIVVGHSMGGVVALVLATGMFGVRVRRAVAFSVKTAWSDDEHAKAEAVARAPARRFDTRAEAIDRYLRVSGLKGLVDPDTAAAAAGVCADGGGFRLAADPLINRLGWTDFASLAHMVKVPLQLLCGERDTIARPESMGRLGAEVMVLPGLGHNPHVEAPEAFWRAIEGGLGRD
ncbi:MAG: alpha/beta hydrolase [Burkholderiales bacterium]|nr:alpha/beta hydrolase [Burkholderiales bacterium]